MTADDLLSLSHAIPDQLHAAGHDDLADACARISEWIEIARPIIRRATRPRARGLTRHPRRPV